MQGNKLQSSSFQVQRRFDHTVRVNIVKLLSPMILIFIVVNGEISVAHIARFVPHGCCPLVDMQGVRTPQERRRYTSLRSGIWQC